MHYDNGPDGARPWPGDERFPFVMVPPDLEQGGLYVQLPAAEVPYIYQPRPVEEPRAVSVEEFAAGPILDVTGLRQLVVYLSYVREPVDQQDIPEVGVVFAPITTLTLLPQVALSVIPRSRAQAPLGYGNDVDPTKFPESLQWFAPAVVDSRLQGAAPTVYGVETALQSPLYAYRNVHMTQLNIPLQFKPQRNTVNVVHQALAFDVSAYQYFRLRFATQYVPFDVSTGYAYPPLPNADASVPRDFSIFTRGMR